jgi:hypothetical protein
MEYIPGRWFGARATRDPDYVARYQELEKQQEALAKASGLGANWRNGPDPRAYGNTVLTWNWSQKDINDYVPAMLNDYQLILAGDGKGNHYRVPSGYTHNYGSPLEQSSRVAKVDDILNTGDDTGVFSFIFGAVAWAQTQQQQNVYFAMPKEGYPHGGHRVKTTAAITSGVGIAEKATAGDSAHPTYSEISVGLKEHEHNVSFSTRLNVMAGADDVMLWSNEMQTGLTEFWTSLDADLLGNLDTTANLNIESLDRVTATDAYETGHSYTSGDADIYGIDRSTASWSEGYVNDNSGTNRALDITFINDIIENSISYWTQPHNSKSWATKYFFTGPASWMDWSQIEDSKQRFTQSTAFTTLPGGLQEIPGQAGGFALTSYLGIPIIVDDNVQNWTSGDSIYLIDGDAVKISIGRPLEVVSSDNPLIVGHYSKANIYLIAELAARRFKGSAAVHDLS